MQEINTMFSVFLQGRGAMSYLASLRPRVVKIMDAKQSEIDDIRLLTPDSIIINRIYVEDGQVNAAIKDDPKKAARDHCNLILSKGLVGVDFYQVQNEQLQHPPELELLNTYYVKLIELAVLNGFKATVIDCSVGNLHVTKTDPGDWRYVFDTLRLAQAHGFPVNCHQYSKGSFWNPDFPNDWYLSRVEETAMSVLDSYGFDKLLYVIGEFGLDNMLGNEASPSGGPGGWQMWLNRPEYEEDLKSIMSYLAQRSDRIMGYCCFVTHANSPWETHEMIDVNQSMASYYSTNPQILAPLIDNAGPPDWPLYQATVIASVLNVRATPGGSVVGTVNFGDIVDVYSDDGDWWEIAGATIAGWSAGEYLRRIDNSLEMRLSAIEEQVAALTLIGANHEDRLRHLEDKTPIPPPSDAQLAPSIDYMGMTIVGEVGGAAISKVFTTHNGSWEVDASDIYAVPQWARDEYLKSPDDPEYHDDAGGDHHIFVRVEDAGGKFIPEWVVAFRRGDHVEYHSASDKHGWCNIPIYHPAFWTAHVDDGQRMSPYAMPNADDGQRMSPYAMPNADGSMPGREHVSMFIVYRV